MIGIWKISCQTDHLILPNQEKMMLKEKKNLKQSLIFISMNAINLQFDIFFIKMHYRKIWRDIPMISQGEWSQ